MATIPPEDPAVYEMICEADTIGVFQIESRAQMNMLPRLKPRTFYDLVIEIAIIRPGPIVGDMVHPYVRRRDGLEAVIYPSEEVRAILEKTLGVPLFQEQAMRLAMVARGLLSGRGRPAAAHPLAQAGRGAARALPARASSRAAWRAATRASSPRPASSSSRASPTTASPRATRRRSRSSPTPRAYLKRYYPAAFTAALLNSQPMGFYAAHTLVEDARRHGVGVLPIERERVVLGLHAGGRGRAPVAGRVRAVAAQAHRPRRGRGGGAGVDPGRSGAFPGGERPFPGAARRAGPMSEWGQGGPGSGSGSGWCAGSARTPPGGFEAARGDGYLGMAIWRGGRGCPGTSWCAWRWRTRSGCFGVGRREALWEIQALGPLEEDDLFFGLPMDGTAVELPPLSAAERVCEDYQATGVSLEHHPLSLLRPQLDRMRATTAQGLARVRPGKRATVGGMAICRQRPPTAHGFCFLSLEDETGIANVVVPPDLFERDRGEILGAIFLYAEGTVERVGKVINLKAQRLKRLSLDDASPA